jgi:hypothetical protein
MGWDKLTYLNSNSENQGWNSANSQNLQALLPLQFCIYAPEVAVTHVNLVKYLKKTTLNSKTET